jgi:hypothetical protein
MDSGTQVLMSSLCAFARISLQTPSADSHGLCSAASRLFIFGNIPQRNVFSQLTQEDCVYPRQPSPACRLQGRLHPLDNKSRLEANQRASVREHESPILSAHLAH